MVWPGEETAWDILSDLDAKDVATNAKASFNSYDSTYALTCFGQDISVSLKDRTFFSKSRLGTLLLTSLGDYSRLSILRYLIHAMDQPLSGQLVRPSDLPGGDIFTKGTHILPLDKAAAYFSDHCNEFWIAGKGLGGTQQDYGDMSLNILPFPRVPLTLILWLGDEEFPSTASLLFDSSCVSYLPPDIIWATSMMAVEIMLMDTKAYSQ
ncbi:MAG: DUF3786 domain-containing protein [Deltaproteobacteria bacterium]|nr:MAG: DUF3786 domain-containing protein [Deltaproteobacteria bacterium]